MKEKNKPFTIFNGVWGLALYLVVFFSFSMVLCAGLLNLLGFKYTSISTVAWFLFTYMVIAFFIEPIIEVFVLAITEIGRVNEVISNILEFIFCVGVDIVILSFLESITNGIWIPNKTIVFYSIITYVGGKFFEALTYKNNDTKTVT